MNPSFPPSMNQPLKVQQLIYELEGIVRWMPDWGVYRLAKYREMVRRGKEISSEDFEKLWKLYKIANAYKSKNQIPPPDEERPRKPKMKSWVQD